MIRRKANKAINKGAIRSLGLPVNSEQVLQDIVKHGTSSVADISARLGMPKSSVYDATTPLLEQSLINEYSSEHGKTFGISEIEQLKRAQEQQLEELKAAQDSLLKFIGTHHKEDVVARPRIKFYSGTLGIKQAFRDMPWKKEIPEAYLLWPAKEMNEIDEEFFRWHGAGRFKHNVFIYTIENHNDREVVRKPKHSWLRNTDDNLVEVRFLPKEMHSKMSFWLYGNTCLFASGGPEKIAFAVHSKEFASMIKIFWQGLWGGLKN